ncbi:EGF domain-specific O-linked N-acetylglucosamine transferase [Agrilus planipennis]|uniref:EGF domain-specific O-linked N-acetylglucosamine transferase n=1 Tax=Agrilus planipennis TaxID=224129 RepID=A0A1W4WWK5_AGRPL|nr:EGF domain-specific O-linked N-acetylglucosamine transferase [Agrilus planipennis]
MFFTFAHIEKMHKVVVIIVLFIQVCCDNYTFINLPDEHIPYYFTNYPAIMEQCRKDVECPYKDHLDKRKCWGYEHFCKWGEQYTVPHCPGDHKGWVKTKLDQQKTFFTQGDFGYIREQIEEMKVLCEPLFSTDSSLECSEHLRFCRGRNIMINFTSLINRTDNFRYKMDVLKEGEIGGYCNYYKDRLLEQADHISPLQSWGPELRYFTQLNTRPVENNKCDIVIEKPTFIMKIDATVNMYHHFCDFFNLYASLHVNSTHPETFSMDTHILIWETYSYYSDFSSAWEAFTQNPLWDLKTFRGEVVCFKNVVFPLLPRMIFGLYYNTPIIYGCEKSGLFHSFSKHLLHRLKIPLIKRKNKKIKITFLSRDTKYRRILNKDRLVQALKENDNYEVQKVIYNKNIPFKKQLEITRNSDIFIGIHGAGLTHLLFLPDWAAVFEIYNCEDENCYSDLARLRGVKYVTWEKPHLIKEDEVTHPESGAAHAKFANYSFDINEFVRLVKVAADHVQNNDAFNAFINQYYKKDNHSRNKHDEL